MLPWSGVKLRIIYGKHSLVPVAQEIDNALWDSFGKQLNAFGIETVSFQLHFNHKYFFNFVTDGDSRNGARRNPINEVKTRHFSIETYSLRWRPVEPLKKLRLGQRALYPSCLG